MGVLKKVRLNYAIYDMLKNKDVYTDTLGMSYPNVVKLLLECDWVCTEEDTEDGIVFFTMRNRQGLFVIVWGDVSTGQQPQLQPENKVEQSGLGLLWIVIVIFVFTIVVMSS